MSGEGDIPSGSFSKTDSASCPAQNAAESALFGRIVTFKHEGAEETASLFDFFIMFYQYVANKNEKRMKKLRKSV